MASRRLKSATRGVPLRETLISAGLEPYFADLLDEMPHRPFWSSLGARSVRPESRAMKSCSFVPGSFRNSNPILSARRQIVALRFPGEGILPRDGFAHYGIQAIVRSEVMVGRAEDFDPIVDGHPEFNGFFDA